MASHPKVGVGYNAQVAFDATHKLIVEQHVTNAGSDLGLLAQTAGAAKEVLGLPCPASGDVLRSAVISTVIIQFSPHRWLRGSSRPRRTDLAPETVSVKMRLQPAFGKRPPDAAAILA